jgi:hypothetical protein
MIDKIHVDVDPQTIIKRELIDKVEQLSNSAATSLILTTLYSMRPRCVTDEMWERLNHE